MKRGNKVEKGGSSSKSNNSTAETLTVVCRFRPPKSGAKGNTDLYAFPDANTTGQSVKVMLDQFDHRMYTFDRVFGSDSRQEDIFKKVENVVDSIVDGFNGTILACK